MHQFADSTRRYIDVGRKLTGGELHRFHEFFQQDFSRVDFFKHFCHVQILLAVVHDFDLGRADAAGFGGWPLFPSIA